MAINSKRIISASVRDVVEFVLRSGDLGAAGHFAGPGRALEGTKGHQRLQKSRPAGYKPEVVISWQREMPDFVFELRGRVDGVLVEGDHLLVEEIKTVNRPWNGPADPLHWAQGKVYAAVYGCEYRFREVEVQLTYLDLNSDETVEFREVFTMQALGAFFEELISEYLEWIESHQQWRRIRDESIKALAFPFKEYRAGQRSMAVAVYRAVKNRAKIFVEAPTGIGKTVSVLFPSIKAMAEGHVEKIFYLTAKTIGRTVAEKTLEDLRATGLRLRAVTLTAKDKICFNNGERCDLKNCPFALGYYDRIKGAVREALQRESFTRGEIEGIAKKHQVCPFELSLDLSLWVDAIICDYNYVFDPTVSLARYFSDERHDYAILIDESHNLAERAREMFSADLEREEILSVKKTVALELTGCARALGKVSAQISALSKSEEWADRNGALVNKTAPETIRISLKKFLEEAESWLVRDEPAEFREPLLDLYFRVLRFNAILECYDERYVTTLDKATGKLRLFCLDPSALLRKALKRTGSTIFFSATLRPGEYFRESLGGEAADSFLQLNSPFPEENLCLMVHDKVATRLRARAASYEQVVSSIEAMVALKTGNYLVYFPSYEYLNQVAERFQALHPGYRTVVQNFGLSEEEREQFISQFRTGTSETLVGFAVLGGIFGEGIDLIGDRLIGVAIVGVGLPQICLERDLIREYWQKGGVSGFDYAYTFPGMNRVLQAVGRLIRSETDRGIVLLMDDRFGNRLYREMFPVWWDSRQTGSEEAIRTAGYSFWSQPLSTEQSGGATGATSLQRAAS